jgi:GNAT superfamily N-acetyltransferase
MDIRVAIAANIPEMHRVRMSVRENILSDASRIRIEHYRQMLDEQGRGWVCEADGRIVGFAVADLVRQNLWALFVEPGYEGRGIGRRLHEAALDWLFESGATAIWLNTSPDTRAERFYTTADWQYAGREPNGEIRFEMVYENARHRVSAQRK